MLSAAANGGEGTIPGDYRPWPSGGGGAVPPPPLPPSGPMPGNPIRRPMPPSFPPPMRGPAAPDPYRPPRRHRRRSLTPEIVIERRSRHPCSSRRRQRVFTIPLDNRPTLGLRGPPKCVIEIERVRCRRRRRPRSYCYEDDYDYDSNYPPPVVAQPQSNVVVANPISVPCAPTGQAGMSNPIEAFLNNLTPEAMDNLPRQTVHLQPIHLPGSQADANTELQTIIFPTEIINPIDGTLSVIQGNGSGTNLNMRPGTPAAMNVAPVAPLAAVPNNIALSSILQRPPINVAQNNMMLPQNIQRPPINLAQNNMMLPQNIQRPPINLAQNNMMLPQNIQRPPLSAASTANPIRQRFLDLFQRLSVSPPQGQLGPTVPPQPVSVPIPSPTVPNPLAPIQPTLPSMSQFEPSNDPYPPANIQPYRSPLTNTSYRPSTFTPSTQPSVPAYRPSSNNSLNTGSDVGPYRPANITPYTNLTTQPANPYPTAAIGVNTAYTPPAGPSMPRSILRNPYPAVQANTLYARFNPSNVSSSSLDKSSITPKST